MAVFVLLAGVTVTGFGAVGFCCLTLAALLAPAIFLAVLPHLPVGQAMTNLLKKTTNLLESNLLLRYFTKLQNHFHSYVNRGVDVQAIQTTMLVFLTLVCLARLIYFTIFFDFNLVYIHGSLFVVLFYYSMAFNEVLNSDDSSDEEETN